MFLHTLCFLVTEVMYYAFDFGFSDGTVFNCRDFGGKWILLNVIPTIIAVHLNFLSLVRKSSCKNEQLFMDL